MTPITSVSEAQFLEVVEFEALGNGVHPTACGGRPSREHIHLEILWFP